MSFGKAPENTINQFYKWSHFRDVMDRVKRNNNKAMRMYNQQSFTKSALLVHDSYSNISNSLLQTNFEFHKTQYLRTVFT